MLVFAIFTANMSAQEARMAASKPTIMHVDEFIASLRGNASTRLAQPQPLRVETLIQDLQPSVYVLSGDVKSYGDKPVCLFTDVRTMNASGIHTADFHSGDIEMVTIKMNSPEELNSVIDLSLFDGLPKLKYIYILSTNPASTKEAIIRMVRNNSTKYSVFYNIQKGA